MKKTYYDILGVPRNAERELIKKAYREGAKKHHPDCSQKEGGCFLDLNKAYETLYHHEKRKAYDRSLDQEQKKETDSNIKVNKSNHGYFSKHPFTENMPPEPLVPVSKPKHAPDCGGFSHDALYDFRQRTKARNDHHRILNRFELTLTPHEARFGGFFPMTLSVLKLCRFCRGSVPHRFLCPVCSGVGSESSELSAKFLFPPGLENGDRLKVTLNERSSKDVIDILFHIYVA